MIKSVLQQNTLWKQMRSEIERSPYLLISTDQPPGDDLAHTNINHDDYKSSLSQCHAIAEQSNKVFRPIFGEYGRTQSTCVLRLSTSNMGVFTDPTMWCCDEP